MPQTSQNINTNDDIHVNEREWWYYTRIYMYKWAKCYMVSDIPPKTASSSIPHRAHTITIYLFCQTGNRGGNLVCAKNGNLPWQIFTLTPYYLCLPTPTPLTHTHDMATAVAVATFTKAIERTRPPVWDTVLVGIYIHFPFAMKMAGGKREHEKRCVT